MQSEPSRGGGTVKYAAVYPLLLQIFEEFVDAGNAFFH